MKKFLSFLTLSLLISLGVVNAQNQKMVVLECFTSATCAPCASINPSLDALISNNEDKLVVVKYHVNWPSDHDPMNQHNPTDVSSKVSFYSVNSVPMSVGNGTWIGNSGSVTQSLINQWSTGTAPVEMRMTSYLNDNQDTMFVVVMGRALEAINSNNLKLNVSIIEKTMQYASAPGTNGEKTFHNVMKKMLPKPAGQSMDALQAGDYFAFKYSWALANVMDVNELTAVAWLQDANTKEVFQGCKSSNDFQPFYEKQAKISEIGHIQQHNCSGNISPYIVVNNFGSETINSMNIKFLSNGEEINTITWEGSLESCGTIKIELGNLSFSTEENNELTFEISAINGGADSYGNSRIISLVEAAPQVGSMPLKLALRTSSEPQLITWDVVNTDNGEVVATGGPYEEANKFYTEDLSCSTSGCYRITMYDAGKTGNVIYGLKLGNQTLFQNQQGFYDKDFNEFSYAIETTDEFSADNANIYPNPSNGQIVVDVDDENEMSIYNMTGQMINKLIVNGKTTINISNLEKGTYMIVLRNKNSEIRKQIIVLQ